MRKYAGSKPQEYIIINIDKSMHSNARSKFEMIYSFIYLKMHWEFQAGYDI